MNNTLFLSSLSHKKFIQISGIDRFDFLQGLVSQDVTQLKTSPTSGIWAAFLTPQGKYLYDFLITSTSVPNNDPNCFLLEIEGAYAQEALKKLRLYKLRSQIDLTLRDDLTSYVLYCEDPQQKVVISDTFSDFHLYVDPRQTDNAPFIGLRLIVPKHITQTDLEDKLIADLPSLTAQSLSYYQLRRIYCAIPDSVQDLESGKTTLLEAGFDALNGISWDKGCYIGQELTARTKYRGLVKKCMCPARLTPAENLSEAPVGTYQIYQDTQKVGVLRSTILTPDQDSVVGLMHLRRTAVTSYLKEKKSLFLEDYPHINIDLCPPTWLQKALVSSE